MNKKTLLFLIISAQNFIISASQFNQNSQDPMHCELPVGQLPRIFSDVDFGQNVLPSANEAPVVDSVESDQGVKLGQQEVRNRIFCCFCCTKPCCESKNEECCDETWCCSESISKFCRIFCLG